MSGCEDGVMLGVLGTITSDKFQSFDSPVMLTSDQTQLTRRGKNVLSSKPAGLITRAVN